MKLSESRRGVCLPFCMLLLVPVAANSLSASEKAISSGRWVIRSEKPASEWEHGTVTGNGRHGARVMGMTDNELIIINHDELFEPHAKEHGEMYRRVVLDLGAAKQWSTTPTEKSIAISKERGVTPLLLEQIHAMGRYLLISSCGKYPSPLQGIWSGNWSPPWQGGFVLDSNVNLQMSSAAMGNLPECARSYFGYIRE